jgi:hypothetical protein
MGGCVSVEEKPCPPGTFSSKELLELNLLRAAAMGNVSEAKTALAAGATTAAKTAVRATARARPWRGEAQRGSPRLCGGCDKRSATGRCLYAASRHLSAPPRCGLPAHRQLIAPRASAGAAA